MILDSFGRGWDLPLDELCPMCRQPGNTGDCNHKPLSTEDVEELGGKVDGAVSDPDVRWCEIPFFPNHLISNTGHVARLYGGVLRSVSIYKSGKYLITTLKNKGGSKSRKIHRLVAQAFLCKQSDRNVVNHKDGNTLNNDASNLEWVTISENVKHAWEIGLHGG